MTYCRSSDDLINDCCFTVLGILMEFYKSIWLYEQGCMFQYDNDTVLMHCFKRKGDQFDFPID